MNTLLDAILSQIEQHDMLIPGESWLVAVSGGPDSMAMLHAILQLRQQSRLELQSLCIAHLNHKLRAADSDADERLVRQTAQKLNLPAIIESTDIAAYAAQNNLSIETSARQLRYDFLERAARDNNCSKIALAHHRDDQVETILHRILRGTGIRGLAGIPPVRQLKTQGNDNPVTLIRPMLSFSRSQIEQFILEENIPCRTDHTNLDPLAATRNKIRIELLPLLRQHYNPQIDQALWQLAHTADMLSNVLEHDLSNITIEGDNNSCSLDIKQLTVRPQIQQVEIVFYVLEKLNIPLQSIGFKHISTILTLLGENDVSDKSTQLPNGLTVRCSQNRLVFEKADILVLDNENIGITPITLTVPGVTVLPENLIMIAPNGSAVPIHKITTIIITPQPNLLEQFKNNKSPLEEMLDLDKLNLPLCIRTRTDNDRFCPLGAAGSKTLGDFFTDHKVRNPIRNRIALLCDPTGILWIPALRIAEKTKITPATNHILKLTLD